MKKLLITYRAFFFPNGSAAAAFVVAIGLVFWGATASFAKDNAKSSPNDSDNGKCVVCHNPHNYHEITIPCDQVDKYLANHPGDFRGPCNVTATTNR